MKGRLSVKNLTRYYKLRQRDSLFSRTKLLKAVDGLTFDVAPGEMLGIVGESGSGKSTTARLLLGHLSPTSGEVSFGGEKVGAVPDLAWRQMRRRMQMIYQDPLGALDPRIIVLGQLEEPLIVHFPELTRDVRRAKVRAVMGEVGLSSHHGERYPHELSGGQRQRVIIARALVMEPELLVCDEPVSALDVSVQAQVLNVFQDIRERNSFTGVFISHDLKVVRQIADRVAVMYLGRIVEIGRPDEVFHQPQHPYSRALVSAVPRAGRSGRERIILSGDPPNPVNVPAGCPFHTRCPEVRTVCRTLRPELVSDSGRAVACHLVNNPSVTREEAA
ncbi:ABC transporter ATP-binding protein [Sinorhizobium meliloti]|uniref:ABC transporter ATP-binding protein n=1 Tax=Rhizobium meliloti TaxID=382 RepID=UPI0003DD9D76|nr:oligopeptide/dipeptide ABC transporter ATP-binding protein [Sinorhizobium meliloti]ARS65901.1 ABC transporter ATP-binding protein [Sinorhizobium meliloti RU11/001]RVG85637.1 ABC transporter ATP-binding protein [Sinorhizobium meliloti]RVH56721.1 ABC transporter ATP-binding protein [Sinorhizobium meliloti]